MLKIGTMLSLVAVSVSAQPQYQRRASIVGGGGADYGKCTIEVVVDGAAEVHIAGENGTLRNLSGQPPQWRRFECTSAMPGNPAGFRFQGIDGRGRVALVSEPRNGSAAVVRIEDSSGGAEGYTFDIMWGGARGVPNNSQRTYDQAPRGPDRNAGGYYAEPRGPQGRVGGGRFTTEEAIQRCREDIRQRAGIRFGSNIQFQNMRLEDNPSRRDWIIGSFTAARSRQLHQFACAVNFDTGAVRWAQIDPPGGRFDYGNADRGYRVDDDAIQNCKLEVADRIRQRGLRNPQFSRIEADDNPGRNDWVVGSVRAQGESFNFSCQVNMTNGVVRSVELNRR